MRSKTEQTLLINGEIKGVGLGYVGHGAKFNISLDLKIYARE